MCFAFLRRRKCVSFHKGTIKTACKLGYQGLDSVFNSIKVRLRRSWRNTAQQVYYQFQFHKGTIKTDVDIAIIGDFLVSIP